MSLHNTSYFREKRLNGKDTIHGVEGTDSMVISSDGVRPRGIRAWEQARLDAQLKRIREMEYHKSFKIPHKHEKKVEIKQSSSWGVASFMGISSTNIRYDDLTNISGIDPHAQVQLGFEDPEKIGYGQFKIIDADNSCKDAWSSDEDKKISANMTMKPKQTIISQPAIILSASDVWED